MSFQGAGGWWTQVTPQTPEQQALVDRVTDLHDRIRAANLEIANLRSRNAPAAQIAQKQQAVTDLRAELAKVTSANSAPIRQMGVPAGRGVCDGTGPKGYGPGRGRCGANCPLCTNPNCPFK
jgi:TolA-binding protein